MCYFFNIQIVFKRCDLTLEMNNFPDIFVPSDVCDDCVNLGKYLTHHFQDYFMECTESIDYDYNISYHNFYDHLNAATIINSHSWCFKSLIDNGILTKSIMIENNCVCVYEEDPTPYHKFKYNKNRNYPFYNLLCLAMKHFNAAIMTMLLDKYKEEEDLFSVIDIEESLIERKMDAINFYLDYVNQNNIVLVSAMYHGGKNENIGVMNENEYCIFDLYRLLFHSESLYFLSKSNEYCDYILALMKNNLSQHEYKEILGIIKYEIDLRQKYHTVDGAVDGAVDGVNEYVDVENEFGSMIIGDNEDFYIDTYGMTKDYQMMILSIIEEN